MMKNADLQIGNLSLINQSVFGWNNVLQMVKLPLPVTAVTYISEPQLPTEGIWSHPCSTLLKIACGHICIINNISGILHYIRLHLLLLDAACRMCDYRLCFRSDHKPSRASVTSSGKCDYKIFLSFTINNSRARQALSILKNSPIVMVHTNEQHNPIVT